MFWPNFGYPLDKRSKCKIHSERNIRSSDIERETGRLGYQPESVLRCVNVSDGESLCEENHCAVIIFANGNTFAACGGPQDHSSAMVIVSSGGSAKSTNGKTLVVYFSATGNTRRLAETAAKALNADLFEIKPEQPYTSQDLDYNDKSTRATVEQNDSSARPKIANQIEKLGQYDNIVLAYPI